MNTTNEPSSLSYIVEQLRPLAVPINDVQPDPKNARTHGAQNMRAIETSLDKFSQRIPIVVNRSTGYIEAGNGRWEAAHNLGWTHIAVVYVEDDAESATGFAIADNRTAELADWNKIQLTELIGELNDTSPELFDALELAELIDIPGLDDPSEGGGAPSEDVPEMFVIIVECEDGDRQKAAYELLTGEGYKCKLSTM